MVYEREIQAVYKILNRVVGGVLSDKELRFLAAWTVLTFEFGEGDALAGAIARRLINRYGYERTIKPLVVIAKKLGVDVQFKTNADILGNAWFVTATEVIGGIMRRLGIEREVRCRLRLLPRDVCEDSGADEQHAGQRS